MNAAERRRARAERAAARAKTSRAGNPPKRGWFVWELGDYCVVALGRRDGVAEVATLENGKLEVVCYGCNVFQRHLVWPNRRFTTDNASDWLATVIEELLYERLFR